MIPPPAKTKDVPAAAIRIAAPTGRPEAGRIEQKAGKTQQVAAGYRIALLSVSRLTGSLPMIPAVFGEPASGIFFSPVLQAGAPHEITACHASSRLIVKPVPR